MAHFHPAGLFDHSPCTVSDTKIVMTRRASFKYFNMWGKAPDFLTRVKEEWDKNYPGHKMFNVVKKLKALKPRLKDLNKECYADIENATNIAESDLAVVQVQIDSDPQNAELIQKKLDITAKLKQVQPARISFLKQKAKTQWLEDGDSNTEAFLDYYESLLGSRNPTEKVRTEVLNQGRCCTAEHTQKLSTPITNEEIKTIFFNTPNDKSPGPDGYTSAFFKDSWDIIGEDICDAIKDYFNSGKLLSQLNATNITLIPKCERPTSVKHFRPIACCNMIYKVISKLMCSRLSLVLPDIVSEDQGAFIKGRSIIENVLICQDIVQMYKKKDVSPRCIFKIDLQKAYDTVEWEFLEQLLHGLGFPEIFSQKVMTCVTSTKFSLCLNELKNDIHQATGFVEGSLPFRYLGVPIKAGRLSQKEYNALVERMINRIRSIGAKKLSYAGRLVLIKSILNTLYSYWAGMFIIPKGVIRRIEGICRNYLWDGSSDYHRVPLVAWDKVTLPKDEGGLAIKKAELCNMQLWLN
ncbi:uncharacterized protein LOC141629760 [Silene latifolia]|uniref:uncharacterized protein LOC141629760 n=1 Tax=Silene latifolia TaxID=37657 RepID=UPI003D774E49